METREIQGVHKDGVRTNIFAPIVGEPATDLHDNIRRETAGSKVCSAASTKGLASSVTGEVGVELLEKPGASWYRAIFAQPQLSPVGEEGVA